MHSLTQILDRISEIFVYWSLVYSGLVDWSIGLAALSGSLMVSYARARAEHLGSQMKGVGIAERPERLLILIVAAFLGQLNAGVLLIALLSAITVVERIMHARFEMTDISVLRSNGELSTGSSLSSDIARKQGYTIVVLATLE